MSDENTIANCARRRIEKETGIDLSNWIGPKVTVDTGGKGYKVEWRPDGDALLDSVLTIYDDGGWELYGPHGEYHDGQMMRLHDKRWMGMLFKEGVIPGLAKSSWMYYKSLSQGKES